jgi:hypothetical protein
MLVGYMPYGDVPGPGWVDWPFSARLRILIRNTPFPLGFCLLMTLLSAVPFLLLLLVVCWMERRGTRNGVIRMSGGLLAGLAVGFPLLYLAEITSIAASAILVALFAGFYFGAVKLPYRLT